MSYIAELQIKVDTTQLDQAKKSLDDLSKISPKVESSTDGISQSLKNVTSETDSLNSAQQRLISRVREQVETFGKAREDVLSYRAGLLGVSGAVDPLVSQLKSLKVEQKEALAAQKEQDAVNRSIAKSQDQLSTSQYRMIESLREEIALFGKSKEEITLYRAGLLGISDQVAPLVEQLNRLKAAKEAEAKAGKETSGSRVSKREAEKNALAEEARELERVIELERQRIRAENQSGGSNTDTTRTREASAALERYTAQLNEVNAKQRQADQSADQLGDEYLALKYAIDPVSKSMDELALKQSRLRELYKSGQLRIPQQEYQHLNKILTDSQKRITDLGSSTGKTAKEINFAMRGLPAQFTDIFVSLQGGQAPLTVFLQQGGQLKDMFGGVGPAFKAMGGYVLGLVNPFTIAAAAVAGLTIAYQVGAAESKRFQASIILTGNAVGLTTDQLGDMAIALDEISTRRYASQVLNEIAGSAKFAGDEIQKIAEIAIRMEQETGKAVSETVEEFEKLAKEPAKASAELNRQYNYLTASVYEQIVALEKEGREVEAVKLAQETFAEAMDSRVTRLRENVGLLESAWRGVKSIFSEAVDWTLDIGRTATNAERIEALEKSIADYRAAGNKEMVERLETEKQILQVADAAQSLDAATEGLRRKNERERIDNLDKWSKLTTDNLSKQQKAEKDIAEIRKVGEKAGKSQLEIEKQIAAYREKNKDKTRPETIREDAASRLLSTMKEQEASLNAQLENTSKIGREAKEYAKLQQEFINIEERQKTELLTVDQKSLLANKDALLAQQEKNVSVENEIRAKQELVKIDTIRAAIEQQIATDRQRYEDALIGATVSDKEAQRLKERNKLQQEYQSQLDAIGKQRREGSLSDEGYEQAKEAYARSLSEREMLLENHYSRLDELQSDWTNGAKKAWANYLESGSNTADLTKSFFENSFSSMEDALVSFVTTGELSFKDLTVSILSDLAKMATRIAANQILMSIIGSFGGGAGAAAGAGSATISSGASFAGYAANGKAFNSGGVEFFANGGAFTNSVVNSPTAFGTGQGIGIMGEAGPEAILPLTRTSDGQLGVKSAGGGTTVVAPVSVTLNADSGVSNDGGDGPEAQGRSAQQAIKMECEKAIRAGLQPGGSIWRAMNNR